MSAELARRRMERLEAPTRYISSTGESYTVEYSPEEFDSLSKEYNELIITLDQYWYEPKNLERGYEYQDVLQDEYGRIELKINEIHAKLEQLKAEQRRIERLQNYPVDELQEIYDNISPESFNLNREMVDDLYMSGKIKLSDDDLANLFGYYLFVKSYTFLNNYLDRNSNEMYLVDVSGLFANNLLTLSQCDDLLERINSLGLIDTEPVDVSASDYIFEEYMLNDYVSEDKDRYTYALSVLLSYGIPLSCRFYDNLDHPKSIKKSVLCRNIEVFMESLEFKSLSSITKHRIDISELPPLFQTDFIANNWDRLLSSGKRTPSSSTSADV